MEKRKKIKEKRIQRLQFEVIKKYHLKLKRRLVQCEFVETEFGIG